VASITIATHPIPSYETALGHFVAVLGRIHSLWPMRSRFSDVTTNPNYEQFDNRTVPQQFAKRAAKAALFRSR
jgi:hypothetical protein